MLDSFRYGIALLCVLTLPFAFGYWFLVHPFVGFWRALGTRISYIILIGMFWVVGAATWPFRGRLLAVEFGTGPTLWLLAALAYAMALFVELQCRKHLTLRMLRGVPELAPEPESDQLLDQGIYGRIRHPRYVSVIFGVLAAALFTNYLASWILLVITFPALLLVVHLEERELRDRFGDAYVTYARRVPRFVPRSTA